MDKLKMHTPNKADENFKKLAALFPNAVTETINENGEVVRAIDKDVLMQEISCTVAVSYTHLDVYKRQTYNRSEAPQRSEYRADLLLSDFQGQASFNARG